jgi:hypothetical protein
VPDLPTFGARLEAVSADEMLALESDEGRRQGFADLDTVMEKVLVKALCGGQVLKVSGNAKQSSVSLRLRSDPDRTAVDRTLARATQERNGAWYIPASAALDIGVVELAHWNLQDPRHLVSVATDRRAEVTLDNADAVAVWSLLEPALNAFALPLKLRAGRWAGRTTKPPSADKLAASWQEAVDLYLAVGLDREALAPFAPGQWGTPRAEDVIERRRRLIESWTVVSPEHIRRLRAWHISKLVTRYYAKAKNGAARRATVLNDRHCERILTAYFAGDWMAFLGYLGEQPHDDEEVIRALPQASLLTAPTAQASSAARAHGVDDDELQRILASYWNQPGRGSPLEQRVTALRGFWREFDALHARQEAEERPLFRLLGSGHHSYTYEPSDPSRAGHLSEALDSNLNRLWNTAVNARFPERLVTEPNPEAAAAASLGPAFTFWHEVGVRAYWVCEGGGADSSLKEFQDSVGKYTERLMATGFGPDLQMFPELVAAEKLLGPAQETWRQVSEEELGPVTVTMGVSGPTRRDGFVILRDIVTRYRQTWAQEHLDAYLEARWRTDLSAAGRGYHQHAANKGKPPTLKQFAKLAAPSANSWFGGNISEVYNVLGLRSPLAQPSYRRLLPADLNAFHRRLRASLDAHARDISGQDRQQLKYREGRLAALGLNWVLLNEAIGERPTLKQFGSSEFKLVSVDLADDVDQAYAVYCRVVQAAAADEASLRTEASDISQPEPARPEADALGAVAEFRDAIAAETWSPVALDVEKPATPRTGRRWVRRLLGR